MKRILLVATFGTLAVGSLTFASQGTLQVPSPEWCAEQVGVEYSVEQGVTERLTDFGRCMDRRPFLGPALQAEAGSDYEVTFDPSTGAYTVAPVTSQ